ncbi:MAG: DUF3810 domain-containing protein [Lachnospiraceae bacterium]|nr:DUF3810 domain-containing protein [Lachnospiraceae bacterium]
MVFSAKRWTWQRVHLFGIRNRKGASLCGRRVPGQYFFSDWYITHVFPVWVNLYGRVTGLFPFSVGEWMLAAGVLLAVLALALGMIWAGIGTGAVLRRIFRGAGRRMCLLTRT